MADQPRRRASDNQPQPWHLDKSVPLGLIAAILVQTIGIVWWAATLNTRVDSLEHVATNNQTDIKLSAPRLAVVESQYIQIKQALDRIETKLDGH